MVKVAAKQTAEIALDFAKLLGFSRLGSAADLSTAPVAARSGAGAREGDEVASAFAAAANKIGELPG
jgi:hypothetical protein